MRIKVLKSPILGSASVILVWFFLGLIYALKEDRIAVAHESLSNLISNPDHPTLMKRFTTYHDDDSDDSDDNDDEFVRDDDNGQDEYDYFYDKGNDEKDKDRNNGESVDDRQPIVQHEQHRQPLVATQYTTVTGSCIPADTGPRYYTHYNNLQRYFQMGIYGPTNAQCNGPLVVCDPNVEWAQAVSVCYP